MQKVIDKPSEYSDLYYIFNGVGYRALGMSVKLSTVPTALRGRPTKQGVWSPWICGVVDIYVSFFVFQK